MDEIIGITRTADSEQKHLILKTLNDFLVNTVTLEKFRAANGMQLVSESLRCEDTALAELSLLIFVTHLGSDDVPVPPIKGLLSFSNHADQKIREFALNGLFKIIERQFDSLKEMPSFLYHLLQFALKPLSVELMKNMIDITLRFLTCISSFPEYILPQLLWLRANVSDRLQPRVVECLVASVNFDVVRMTFPAEFWKTTAADFQGLIPLYRAFIGHLPAKFTEMILTLRDLSAERADALSLLVEFTRDCECAELIVTRLPIQNQTSPALLFQLYSNLSQVEGSSLLIGQENEFYMVCKLVLSSPFQHDACKLLRKIALNPILLESSGLIQHISFLITLPNDAKTLWNLMSVVFTLSRDRYFQCFAFIVPHLKKLLAGDVLETKVGAFLCLANFAESCTEVEPQELIETASFLVNVGNGAVRDVCIGFLNRSITELTPAELMQGTRVFTATFTTAHPKSSQFAALLLPAVEAIPGFDESLLQSLGQIRGAPST
jgi:hypothetical protein